MADLQQRHTNYDTAAATARNTNASVGLKIVNGFDAEQRGQLLLFAPLLDAQGRRSRLIGCCHGHA